MKSGHGTEHPSPNYKMPPQLPLWIQEILLGINRANGTIRIADRLGQAFPETLAHR